MHSACLSVKAIGLAGIQLKNFQLNAEDAGAGRKEQPGMRSLWVVAPK